MTKTTKKAQKPAQTPTVQEALTPPSVDLGPAREAIRTLRASMLVDDARPSLEAIVQRLGEIEILLGAEEV